MQVKRVTQRCQIIGRRFPIAIVMGPGGKQLEISSLSASQMPPDAAGVDRLAAQVRR